MSESPNHEGLDLTQQPDDTLALTQAQPEAEPETALEPAPLSGPGRFMYLIREKCGTEIELVYRHGDSLFVRRRADSNILTTASCPLRAAACSAALPRPPLALTSAPWASSC